MNQFKPQTHHFRTVKTIQLFFTVIVFLLYLICMAAFPDFRVSAASDNLLPLFPHLLIWILTIGSLLFLYFDYKYFYKTIQESDSLRRSAYLDDLTGMPNRFSCDLVFQMYAGDTSKIEHVACALITISNLIQTNITFGRDAGNQILIDFSNILEEVGEDYGFVGRNGGNEFLLVIENCSQQYMEAFFDKLNIRIKRYNALELNNPIEINYKYILNDTLHATRFSDIITEVYNQLHKTNF